MPVIYGNNHKESDDDGYSDDSGMDSKDGMAKEDNDDSASALLPKSVLGDHKLKPGDQVILEVVHIYEDEVEVKYGKKNKKDKDKDDSDENEDKPDRNDDDDNSAGSQMDMSQKQLSGLMDE